MLKCYYPFHLKHYIFELRGHNRVLDYFSSGISSNSTPETMVNFTLLEGKIEAGDLGIESFQNQKWYWFVTIVWGRVYINVLIDDKIPDITYFFHPPLRLFTETKYLTTRRMSEEAFLERITGPFIKSIITSTSKEVYFNPIDTSVRFIDVVVTTTEEQIDPKNYALKRIVKGITDRFHFLGVMWLWSRWIIRTSRDSQAKGRHFELLQFENDHLLDPRPKTYFENFFNKNYYTSYE